MDHRLKYVLAAGLAVTGLAAASAATLLLTVDPARCARDLAEAMRARYGTEVVLPDVPHWQLWPPALQLGRLTLADAATREPLLQAADASVRVLPGSLLSGHPRVAGLALTRADLFLRRHDDGGSNWHTLLAALQGDSGASVRVDMENCALQPLDADGRPGPRIDIASAALQPPREGGAWSVDAAFSVDSGGDIQLVTQHVLHAAVTRTDSDSYHFGAATLHSMISSPRFPGVIEVDVRGEMEAGSHGLAAPLLSAHGSYRNMTMREAMPFRFSAPLAIDFTTGLTSRGARLEVGKSGASVARVRADLSAEWQAQALRLLLDNGEWQSPRLHAHAVRLIAQKQGSLLTVTRLHGDIGNGTFDIPLTLDTAPDTAALSMAPDLRNLEIPVLVPLLDAGSRPEGRFSLTGKLRATGMSPERWLDTAQGSFSLRADGVRMAGSDPGEALVAKLQAYQAFLPALAPGAATHDAPTTLRIAAENSVAAGSIHSKARIDMPGARIDASGIWRIDRQAMDYAGSMHLDRALFSGRPEEVVLPFNCRGNPATEQLGFIEALDADCRVDEAFTRQALASALSRRFSGK